MEPNPFVIRRERLCENGPPPCPKCGEKHQIQLVNWISAIRWKCRMCKTEWLGEEPKE